MLATVAAAVRRIYAHPISPPQEKKYNKGKSTNLLHGFESDGAREVVLSESDLAESNSDSERLGDGRAGSQSRVRDRTDQSRRRLDREKVGRTGGESESDRSRREGVLSFTMRREKVD